MSGDADLQPYRGGHRKLIEKTAGPAVLKVQFLSEIHPKTCRDVFSEFYFIVTAVIRAVLLDEFLDLIEPVREPHRIACILARSGRHDPGRGIGVVVLSVCGEHVRLRPYFAKKISADVVVAAMMRHFEDVEVDHAGGQQVGIVQAVQDLVATSITCKAAALPLLVQNADVDELDIGADTAEREFFSVLFRGRPPRMPATGVPCVLMLAA